MAQTIATLDEPIRTGEPAERPVTVVVGYDGSPAADAAFAMRRFAPAAMVACTRST